MGRLFGSRGIRGIANGSIDGELAFMLGQAVAYVIGTEKSNAKIIIGKDTRISGDMLESALVAGVCSVGAEAIITGVIPTPGIAYLTHSYGADAGIVITASHNLMEYNGLKFFDSNGYKLSEDIESRIESIVLDSLEKTPKPTGDDIGRRVYMNNALKDYVSFLKSTIKFDLSGMIIALDCANGSSFEVAPEVFEELGAKVYLINNNPNGVNINEYCGIAFPNKIQEFVIETDANIGFVFDGDADSVAAVDEHGSIVDGEQILGICGLDMKERGLLNEDTLVGTESGNPGLYFSLIQNGCNMVRTKNGHQYVLKEMLENGYNLGGDQSGHIIFLDYNTTGDGILSALQLVATMKRTNKPLSELAGVMNKLPHYIMDESQDEGNLVHKL